MTPPPIASQITFLYYRDLAVAQHFYETVLGLTLVEDQGWAKIYQINGAAFLGIVDEAHGSLKVKEDSAVMVTLVVDDVPGWYDYLRGQDVVIRRELGKSDEIQIEYFFVEDPGGYVLEFQKFLKPALAQVFGLAL